MCRLIYFFLTCLMYVCSASAYEQNIFLVYGGKTGWIGQKLVHLIQERNFIVYCGEARLEDRIALEKEIEAINPNFIFNAAGVTGRPNVDWCEDHKQETIRANLIGALNLADISSYRQIHLTNFGTGCIYSYDTAHPCGSGIGFTEEDKPNFTGSFYSETKGMLNSLLPVYPNVLNLRLRMPISSDLHHRSFITKIIHYKKIVSIPNSMTVLDDLLPLSIDMALHGLTGHYNFTNPGTISHNEILTMYREYVDPAFVWENISEEELHGILKSQRSNNELDVTKLLKEFPFIPHIKESVRQLLQKMGQK